MCANVSIIYNLIVIYIIKISNIHEPAQLTDWPGWRHGPYIIEQR